MHYFRYRPYSEISLKELLYSEMYFSSIEECNDPFDSKTFYVFDNDKEKWSKLIKFSVERTNAIIPDRLLHSLVEHLSQKCPLTFEEALNKNLLEDFITTAPYESSLINFIAKRLQDILEVYKPPTRYFVSFSKVNSELLMWSHYANKHKGFCLVFKAIDGELNLSPNFEKDQIRRQTPNGLAAEMSYALPKKFKFSDIDYKQEVETLNAFLHMPVSVTVEASNEAEQLKITADQQIHYQQKGQNWVYENEARLILPPPPPWLFGGHIDYSKQERLFHYEPSQLAGIIYGARMTVEEKNRVKEVLEERKNLLDRISNYPRTVFRFVEFEARLSTHQRNVDIKPISIMGMPTTDKDFDRLYNEWLEGIGHLRDGNGSKRIKVN